MGNARSKSLALFGGIKAWNPDEWTASDDRVRGGSSQSYLDCSAEKPTALFHGTLDTSTLGGAGFASQRTTWEDRTFDLSAYDGIELDIAGGDSKRYTFILKDELLPKNPENGREQSTISYEYDFQVPKHLENSTGSSLKLFIPWDELQATYRGKGKKDAPELNLKSVKRFSIMCRSFFDKQDGDFELELQSISATTKPSWAVQKDLAVLSAKTESAKDLESQYQADPEKGLNPRGNKDGGAGVSGLIRQVDVKLANLSLTRIVVALTLVGVILVVSQEKIARVGGELFGRVCEGMRKAN